MRQEKDSQQEDVPKQEVEVKVEVQGVAEQVEQGEQEQQDMAWMMSPTNVEDIDIKTEIVYE
jgi:hypothetical protein